MRTGILVFLLTIFSTSSQALYMELGVNYNYKKTFIDQLDNVEQQGTTGSISFYFMEKLAVELSYTNAIYVKRERADANVSTTAARITTQYSDIYGADLIYVFADRKAQLQPYIKGGAAYIKKKQTSQVDGDPTSYFEIIPKPGWAPSYGAGFKFFLTDAFALRAGIDVVRTPIDDSSYADDLSGRVGLSWIF